MFKNPATKLLALLAVSTLIILGAGCESDSTAPDPNPSAGAPVLPSPDKLDLDLSFFDSGKAAEKIESKENFFNAYLRVVVIDLMVAHYLTPPVAAFALALNTPPSHQEDGSWIWVYTYVNGEEEVQIRLRGEVVGETVQWELRVSAPSEDPPLDNVLWFAGQTSGEGQFGQWTFHDFTLEGNPAVASLEWGTGLDGDFLILTSLQGEDAGDTLAYYHNPPDNRMVYTDASEQAEWFIHWNEVDGTGSLMVPEYNDGQEACWDEEQNDVACEPVP